MIALKKILVATDVVGADNRRTEMPRTAVRIVVDRREHAVGCPSLSGRCHLVHDGPNQRVAKLHHVTGERNQGVSFSRLEGRGIERRTSEGGEYAIDVAAAFGDGDEQRGTSRRRQRIGACRACAWSMRRHSRARVSPRPG